MASTSAPYGLVPLFHPSGIIRPVAMQITSGYATTIYQNQPIKIVPSSTGEGTIAAAAVNDRFIGTFAGCQYTTTDGRFVDSNMWVASSTAQSGTTIVAWVYMDPSIIYGIQTNAAVTVADIGKQMDFTAASGNATTGLSGQMLDVASATTNAALQILNITPGPNNAWSDTYVNVQVRISEHQMVADVAAF